MTKGRQNWCITLSMATQGIKKIEKQDIVKNFIIEGNWPSGVGATILLSTVIINDTKLSSLNKVLQDCQSTLKSVYKNGVHPNHAERLFLDDLRQEIGSFREVEEIQIHLVQNYSPCTDCADRIVGFKNENENVFLKITFANIYESWKDASKEGLRRLLQSGIELELLEGVDKWKQFLNNESFIILKTGEYKELLVKATSSQRNNRENEYRDMLEELCVLGEQMIKVYILTIHFKRCIGHLHAHML